MDKKLLLEDLRKLLNFPKTTAYDYEKNRKEWQNYADNITYALCCLIAELERSAHVVGCETEKANIQNIISTLKP